MHVLDESTNIAANLHCLCYLSSGLPGVQFHYAFWEISFVSKRSKSRLSQNPGLFLANNIG